MKAAIWCLVAMGLVACGVERDAVTEQAVAGPTGVTVAVRAADQLAVSWTGVTGATKYYVYQGTAGSAPAYAASVTGSPPATSYIATGISAGVSYCFAASAVFADGTDSDLSAVVCASTAGPSTPHVQHLVLGAAELVPLAPSLAIFFGTHWQLQGTTQALFPVEIPVGCTIVGWDAVVQKGSAATAMAATLQSTSFTVVTPLSSVDAAGQLGTLDLASSAVSIPIEDAKSYSIVIARSGAAAVDLVYRGGVAYTCPD